METTKPIVIAPVWTKPLGDPKNTETFFMEWTALKMRIHIDRFVKAGGAPAGSLFCDYCQHWTLATPEGISDCCHAVITDRDLATVPIERLVKKADSAAVFPPVPDSGTRRKTSVFRGVHKLSRPYQPKNISAPIRPWRATLQLPGCGVLSLGDYASEEDAANAYDNAVFWLSEEGWLAHPHLNHPENYLSHPGLAPKYPRTSDLLFRVKLAKNPNR